MGVACAGELYFAASFTVSALLILLRFGPRQNGIDEDEDESDHLGDEEDPSGYGSYSQDLVSLDSEHQPLKRSNVKNQNSVRKRAALGGIL